jgi:hypothetical protein
VTRRTWAWVVGLTILAAVDLGATLRAHASWHPPAGDSQASLSLGQLVGFVSSALLFALALAIAVHGVRSWSARRRRHRLVDRIDPRDTDWAG